VGEVVNLKLVRKRKARAEQDERAASNRALFGRTKAEKSADQAERVRAFAALDAHKRETDGDR
jgi:hypothetical protein